MGQKNEENKNKKPIFIQLGLARQWKTDKQRSPIWKVGKLMDFEVTLTVRRLGMTVSRKEGRRMGAFLSTGGKRNWNFLIIGKYILKNYSKWDKL